MSSQIERPPRPAIPPSLYALAAVFLGGWLAGLPARTPSVWVPVTVLAVLALTWVVMRWREVDVIPTVVWLVATACAMGALSQTALQASVDAAASALGSRSVSSCDFVVASEQTEGRYGRRCRARVLADGRPIGEVWLTCSEEAQRGDVLRGVGRFAPAKDDERGAEDRSRGICGSVSLKRVSAHSPGSGPVAWLSGMRHGILARIEPSSSAERALLAALACGDRSQLAAFRLDDTFAACGISHLVAISGAHVSIATALLSQLLERTRLRPLARMSLLGTASLGLVTFCGAPVSALRAWLMSMVAFGSALVGRRRHGLSAVCIVACVMALAMPAWMGELGFRLSVLSVVGLCLFGEYAGYVLRVLVPDVPMPHGTPARVRRSAGGALAGLRSAAAATVVAQLTTLPVTIPVFARASLVAPLANALVAVPFQTCVGVGMAACALSGAPLVGGLSLAASDALCAAIIAIVRLCAKAPMASVAVSSDGHVELALGLLAAVALLVWWPEVSRRTIAPVFAALATLALCLMLRWRLFAPARMVVLDVGQGDAILVQDGEHAVLVDAGVEGSLGPALSRQHVFHLDAVILTHLHDDHYGGLSDLVGTVGVDRVIVAQGVSDELGEEVLALVEDLADAPPEEVALHDVLHVGGFELRVVWPTEPVDGHENQDSLEMVLTYESGERRLVALLTGDGEQEELQAMLDAHDVPNLDVLKVGHHGSEVSIEQNQAELLDPELSVASAGAGNSYGHPTSECVEALEGAGSAFLCTMDVGDVEITPQAGGVAVTTFGAPATAWLEGAV